jgi:hypothetical protein
MNSVRLRKLRLLEDRRTSANILKISCLSFAISVAASMDAVALSLLLLLVSSKGLLCVAKAAAEASSSCEGCGAIRCRGAMLYVKLLWDVFGKSLWITHAMHLLTCFRLENRHLPHVPMVHESSTKKNERRRCFSRPHAVSSLVDLARRPRHDRHCKNIKNAFFRFFRFFRSCSTMFESRRVESIIDDLSSARRTIKNLPSETKRESIHDANDSGQQQSSSRDCWNNDR